MEMTMVITATFPLGVFLGHQADGSPAGFPDTTRLHAALMNAAGQGTTANLVDGRLAPSESSLAALQWLEENAPTGLVHPAMSKVAIGRRRAESWRAEGVPESKANPTQRKVLKGQSDGVAVAGPLAWCWDEPVPDDIRRTLDALCADVSCLGEAESPVILEMPHPDGWTPSHKLDPDATAFSTGGVEVRTPLAGRSAELEAVHRAAYPAKLPTPAADRHAWDRNPSSHTPPTRQVASRIYRPAEKVVDAPWDAAIVVRTSPMSELESTIDWSVALHRALVAAAGDDAGSFLTGVYPEDKDDASTRRTSRPANRLAIHVVPAHPARRESPDESTFVLLIPHGTSPEDLATLDIALRNLRRIYRRGASVELLGSMRIDADTFWSEPAPGTVRLWRPYPGLVPEVRRAPVRDGKGWSLADGGLLAVGHVFRDEFALVLGAGGPRYQFFIDAARSHGVRWHEVVPIRKVPVGRYAHKTPEDLTVQPFTGLVDMAHMVAPTTIFALGQSRHLGGGLMIPEDVPEILARQRGLAR